MDSASKVTISGPDQDRLVHRTVLLALPWLIFVLNPNWVFQDFGALDPWYYFGHFIHFPREQILFPTYAGERLTWILPGYALVHLLTPVYGTLALHFLTYYCSVFSLYSLVRLFAGARAALIAGCVIGCHSFFISSNGSNYVTGGCLAYCLLAFALIAQSASAKSPAIWMVAAGLSWAALGCTYAAWLLFTPTCLFMYMAAEELAGRAATLSRESLQRTASAATVFAAGAIVLTLALAIVHSLVYGSSGLSFQKKTIEFSIYTSRLADNPYVNPNFSWSYADWMVFPALTAFLSLFLLLPRSRRWIELRAGVGKLALLYLYSFAVMALMTMSVSRLLEFDYFACMLIPGMFIVLGVTVFAVPLRLDKLWFWLVLGLACAVSIAPLADPGLYMLPSVGAAERPALLLAAALLIRFLRPQSIVAWSTGMLVLAASSFFLIPESGAQAWHSRGNWMNATHRVGTAVQTIVNRLPGDKHPAFWFNDADSTEFRAIMAAFLAHGISMRNFPTLDAGRGLTPGQVLVLLTPRKTGFDWADLVAQRAGIALSLLWQQQIASNGVSYWITATEVRSVGQPGAKALPLPLPLWALKPGEPKRAGDNSSGLALDRWAPSFGPGEMTMTIAPDGLHVTTARKRFAYALMYPVLTAPYSGVYRFDLKYRVLQGGLAFGALSVNMSGWIGQAGNPEVSGPSLVKSFEMLLSQGETFRLLVSNSHPTGDQASTFVLEELKAFGTESRP